ncbi:MAG: DeoR/GlpR family DNA-binding transcription regulator [Pseudomonadota bacterium]
MERHERLLRAVEAERTCAIGELAVRLGVSEETVRRDVKELESQGKLHKLHGAVRLPDNAFETPFDVRVGEQSTAKAAIALAAAALIADNSSVFIDSGSTSLHVARALRGHRQLSVVTNAIDVAHELCSINNNRVFLAGGEIDQDYRAAFGVEADIFLGRFTPDVAILSIGAIDPALGLMDFHLGEAAIKRSAARLARSVLLVADATKLGRRGLVQTCPCSVVTTFVTDAAVPPAFRACFTDAEIRIASA